MVAGSIAWLAVVRHGVRETGYSSIELLISQKWGSSKEAGRGQGQNHLQRC